jgi:hypothetical protein
MYAQMYRPIGNSEQRLNIEGSYTCYIDQCVEIYNYSNF